MLPSPSSGSTPAIVDESCLGVPWSLNCDRKGLDVDVIAEAVAPIDRDAEARVAAELAAAKARSLAGQPYEIALRRLVGVLGRRGFAGDLAWQAAKEALSERPDVDLEMGEQVDLHPKG